MRCRSVAGPQERREIWKGRERGSRTVAVEGGGEVHERRRHGSRPARSPVLPRASLLNHLDRVVRR